MITLNEVRKLNKKGNVVPLFDRIPSDLDTPVSAFMKLAAKKENSFLLESIEGGEKLARYSFIGFDPFLVIEGDSQSVLLRKEKSTKELKVPAAEFIAELFKVYRPVKVENLPRFTGGAVGYFAYDTIRWYEDIPDNNSDIIKLPELLFGLYSRIVVFVFHDC